MVGHSGRHRWRSPQRLMVPGEVVVHVMQADRMGQILDLLAERIGQSRKPAHSHPHCEVLTLDIGRTDLRQVGISPANINVDASTDRRAIASFP